MVRTLDERRSNFVTYQSDTRLMVRAIIQSHIRIPYYRHKLILKTHKNFAHNVRII